MLFNGRKDPQRTKRARPLSSEKKTQPRSRGPSKPAEAFRAFARRIALPRGVDTGSSHSGRETIGLHWKAAPTSATGTTHIDPFGSRDNACSGPAKLSSPGALCNGQVTWRHVAVTTTTTFLVRLKHFLPGLTKHQRGIREDCDDSSSIHERILSR
jgi:hypothetical protein